MEKSQRTEKLLFGTLSVFLLALAFNFFTGEFRPTQSASADEGSNDEASAPSTKSEDEKSEDDSKSEDEKSEDDDSKSEDEKSVASTPSVKPVTTQTTKRTTTQVGTKEESVDDVSVQSIDDVSVKTEGETSVKSVDDETSDANGEESQNDENSEASFQPVTDPNASANTEVVTVKRGEKFFFLVPVEVESQMLVDGNGNVIAEKKNFINWLKSIFSR